MSFNPSDRSDPPFQWRILGIHLILLILLSGYCLHVNEAALLNGLDGSWLHGFIDQQATWKSVGPSLALDPIRGPGNLAFPLNSSLIFPYRLQTLFGTGLINLTVAGVLFSLELFIAVFLLGHALRMGAVVSLWGAWVAVSLIMPFFWPYLFYPMVPLIPHLGESIAVSSLIVSCLHISTPRGRWSNPLLVLTITAFTLQLIWSNPLLAVLFVPVSLIYGVAALGLHWRNTPHRNRILLSATLILILLAVSGSFQYLLGLASYSAPAFFNEELYKTQSTDYFASIFFHLEPNNVGRPLFILAAVGALLRLLTEIRGSPQQIMAIVHLITMATILGGGLFLVNSEHWQGPSMFYFEVSFWPLYYLYAAHGVGVVFGLGRQLLSHLLGRRLHDTGKLTVPIWLLTLPALALPLYAAIIAAPPMVSLYNWPPTPTPLSTILKQELGVLPGSPFRGRLATITGSEHYPDGLDWLEMHALDSGNVGKTNNDHRFVGPPFDNVPILQEYNQTLTPTSYLLFTRTLSRPQDRQVRNIILFTRADTKLLTAQGVRFVITDVSLSMGHRRAALNCPKNGGTLQLWELPDPNLGHYSPTRVRVVADAKEALTLLRDTGDGGQIDFKHEVVLFTTVEETLTPATDVSLRLAKDGIISLRASSGEGGASLLLLPFEYSACMQLVSDNETARLMRANINQTALIFRGELTADLVVRYGPFTNAGCRLQDKREFAALKPQEATRAFPLTPTGER